MPPKHSNTGEGLTTRSILYDKYTPDSAAAEIARIRNKSWKRGHPIERRKPGPPPRDAGPGSSNPIVEAKAHYGDSITTPELGEEIGDAVVNGDFYIQFWVTVHINGKLALRKILHVTSRRTFDIRNFEEHLMEQIDKAVNGLEFEVVTRMAVIKHDGGRGGSKQHNFETSQLQPQRR
ncbi:uncharacterized protein ATNIH1004_011735 [Aspergillus tanneri]|uniref:Uncharacterized protein n=1 Tax=Aspergillus tanneri TaxID=1220188 RepID=A0A5M9MAN0_9EURO|nr:uncharacterized protein ATNIH1004_011735 [Aspergillus tanneri]KAA8641599.1 hypothetical protein ATNIH1004_011735 [Aspergillus tanneri]